MKGRILANKWLKTEALLSDSRIVNHIPETRIYNRSNLHQMLDLYGSVVIKPIIGSGGSGVIKVTKEGSTYQYEYYQKLQSFEEFDSMFLSLSAVKRKRAYLIQRGIQLATIEGRPIDYRVKVVKSNNRWGVRAIVGRLAREGLFVTNLCKGGTLLPSVQGISQSLPDSNVSTVKRELRKLTNICIKILEWRYPGIDQLGFDYGIDRSGHIWIFEVNTRPQ